MDRKSTEEKRYPGGFEGGEGECSGQKSAGSSEHRVHAGMCVWPCSPLSRAMQTVKVMPGYRPRYSVPAEGPELLPVPWHLWVLIS